MTETTGRPAGPPPAPSSAAEVFGDRLGRAERFAQILADTGVSHGLIGPREVPILWERHILNCAVVHEAFPADARVVDVGSGAGLPGIALALARPDLQLVLVEPMQRRTDWLEVTVADLGLETVQVRRARAEELHGELDAPFVTARAVARIDKLARWCLPLTEPGGRLVAMKGRTAPDELAAAEKALRRAGGRDGRVGSYGATVLPEPTLTIEVTRR